MIDKAKATQKKRNGQDCARLEAFSDGVFAIAITLLVLELLEVPRPPHGVALLPYYLGHWHSLLAFAIGFCTILICWINHHHMFSHIEKCDSHLMWVNGFLLAMVTFTPFPTAILAEYVESDSTTAVGLFGLTYFLMSVAYSVVWHYAYSRNLLHSEGDQRYFKHIRATYVSVLIYTGVAFFVCFYSITAAIILYALMFAVFAYPREFALLLYRLDMRRSVAR